MTMIWQVNIQVIPTEAFKRSENLIPSIKEDIFMQGQTTTAWWQKNREQSEIELRV